MCFVVLNAPDDLSDVTTDRSMDKLQFTDML